jgi:hypothetical protein
MIRQMILKYTYGGINRSFSGRLRLSVIFDYPANGNRSFARKIEVLLYMDVQPFVASSLIHYCGLVRGAQCRNYNKWYNKPSKLLCNFIAYI